MLACLPASGDIILRLLRTQMNTGPQIWETTQKMRSARYPTPAELDAYAKKVANRPLSIQIFPNSIKVPQRKHVRRTVNGLDTSSSAQRHSPYPSQVSASAGLLAVLRAPAKRVDRESDASRARQLYKATMNPHGGSYVAPSTLAMQVQPAAQKQGIIPPQAVQQGLTHPMALQHRSLTHAMHTLPPQQHRGAPQQQAPSQALQGLSCPPQRLPHQVASQDLRHISDSALQHNQGSEAFPPPASLQPPPAGPYGSRKLPDADAPPNVTVSTSTIPLSMAASLQQNRPGDLSSIVLQINQLCQARAGTGATSVCEGQIANPSPISRNLLINASTRVSAQHPPAGGIPACLALGATDKAAAQSPGAALHLQSCVAPPSIAQPFDAEKVQLQQLLQQQQRQRSWAQHQMCHLQQPPEGAHPCKNPRLESPAECAFPSHTLSYHKMPAAAQAFPPKHPVDKPRPPSPTSCQLGSSVPYMNGHYLQPQWNAGPAAAFQGGQADRVLGAKYRPGKGGTARMAQGVDYMGGDFQVPTFQEQSLEVMKKMHHRATTGRQHEPGAGGANNNGGGVRTHHPGYC